MAKLVNSLETKLTLSFVILIIVISGLAFFYTYTETKNALRETMRDELMALASVTASQINGDDLAAIKEGGENEKPFKTMAARLLRVQTAHPDIKYVYIYNRLDDKRVRFLVDPSYGIENDAAKIGEVYDDTTPDMMRGLVEPASDKDITPDKWGSFISGYSPIRDSKGNVVAAVGIDMLAKRMMEKQDFIGNTIYFIIGIAVVIAGIIILLFSATIIRDINKLNRFAEEVSTGNIDRDVDVKRNDEVGELAESFQRMIMSLRIMRMYPDEKKDKK